MPPAQTTKQNRSCNEAIINVTTVILYLFTNQTELLFSQDWDSDTHPHFAHLWPNIAQHPVMANFIDIRILHIYIFMTCVVFLSVINLLGSPPIYTVLCMNNNGLNSDNSHIGFYSHPIFFCGPTFNTSPRATWPECRRCRESWWHFSMLYPWLATLIPAALPLFHNVP